MKGSGWGCGLIILFALMGLWYMWGSVSQETEAQKAKSETASLDTIGKLADSNAEMAKAIEQNGETINDLAGEVVEQSRGTREENKQLLGTNKLLIGLVAFLVLGIVVIAMRGGKRGEA